MKSVVHQTPLYVCQWTGETISKKFKIPTKGLKEWKGCYGSPSVCVSAIAAYGESEKLSADTIHELYDVLVASLRFEKGKETSAFTITPAPNWRRLTQWGGDMDLDSFHDVYDHDFQVESYHQEISSAYPGSVDGGDEAPGKISDVMERPIPASFKEDFDPPNAPKKWHKRTLKAGAASEPERVVMPRCVRSLIDWLREYTKSDEVTVHLSPQPRNNAIFALGWKGESRNDLASEMLGKEIRGDAVVFHKNQIKRKLEEEDKRDKKRRKTKI